MLLKNKKAVIYGASGAIGSAVARAFAAEGAQVFLAGRTDASVQALATQIRADGGRAEAAQVDALDEAQVQAHANAVAVRAGGIDIALNAIGLHHVQGTPFLDLSVQDFSYPIDRYLRSNFLTSQAVARHMAVRRSGVILTLSTPGSRMAGAGFMGYGVTCAATEWFSRLLAAELASSAIRVVCLRPHAIPEAVAHGSHTGAVFAENARGAGMDRDTWLAGAAAGTFTGALPRLAQVAQTAVFAASEHAAAMTGTVLNLSSGAVSD